MQYNDNEERMTPDQLDDDLNINNYAHSSNSPMQNALAQIGLGIADTSPFLQQGQAIEALNAAQWQTRVAAIKSLGALKERATVDLLIKSLGDEHGNVRVAAVRALAMHSDQASVASLTAALHDPAWYVRAAAAQSLGKMRGRTPIDELVQAVNDEDESVRAAAVWALGQAGIRAPVEPLLAALLDPAWLVREAAELALDELNIQELDRSPTNGEEQFSVTPDDRQVGSINKRRRFSFQRIVETGLVAAVLIMLLASWIIIAQRPRTGSPAPSIAPAPIIYRGYTGGVYGGVYKLSWSPDGTLIASGDADGSVLVWNASTGKTVDHYTSPVSFVKVLSMVWLPHNYLLILSERADNTIDAWNPITGSIFLSLALQNSISVGAWSPDGQRVAIDAGDHTIQVWNVFSKQKISIHPVQTQANISALVWSTDATQIASATYDGSIQIWKASTGRNASLPIKNMGDIVALSWSSDGTRIALATSDDSVQIWSKTSSGNARQVLRHSTGSITSFVALAWSPGDLFLAASDNTQVQIWNATTRKQLMLYRGHTDRVNDAQWSPDGTRIASASLDKSVQVWLVF